MTLTQLEIRDGVAVIVMENPPVNSLGHALRESIVQAMDAVQADRAVRAIVLTGNANAFSAGADVTEFGTPRQLQEPILRSVIARVESSRKPIVAAIEGAALGGGLELALACHSRVAHEAARVGLPEVSLGLIPGSGGTQRLPRLVGIQTALELMFAGTPRTARDLQGTGLFDEVVAEDAVVAAVARATALAKRGAPFLLARDRVLDGEEVQRGVEAQRARMHVRQKSQPAYAALLDAVAASALPFEQGLQKERELSLQLISTTVAQALRYQFKGEREATRLPATLQARPRALQIVAVIGAGTMGSGIAISLLNAGLSVILFEQDEAALERGCERIHAHHQNRVSEGKLSAADATSCEARLAATLDWARLGEADLVIEAVFEDLQVKQAVFREMDRHARPDAVMATNTSYLDVDAIAAVTSRPQDVLGLHFFSPAHVMKLLEVVRGAETAPAVVATGMALGALLKKTPVLTANAFGFIGNRIYNAYRRQCEFMLEDGAFPEDVDRALTDFGFAMGPFAVADLSGLDIAWRMRRAQAASRDPRERYVDILDQLCEMGRLGRKVGAGYYAYPGGRQTKVSDATVREIIETASSRRGISRRILSAQEIQRRALLAMANEAALLLAEGVAVRSSDVDVVLVQGYGFPRWEGGPVFWARLQGQPRLDQDLKQMATEVGHGFVLGDPASLFSI